MAVAYSLGLRNYLLNLGSLKSGLQGGILQVLGGPVPADANAAETGTLLLSLTELGATWAAEVLPFATITLSGTPTGQITQVQINGVINMITTPVPFNGSFAQTAIDLATELNKRVVTPKFWASASGNVVTLYPLPGTGTSSNGWTCVTTVASMTATATSFGAGGGPAVTYGANGVRFASASGGLLSKVSSQILQGTVLVDGVAPTHWRIYTSAADNGSADPTGLYRRAQGVVSPSGQFTLAKAVNMVFEGDSLTTGAGASAGNDFPTLAAALLGTSPAMHNLAVSGSTLKVEIPAREGAVDLLFDSSPTALNIYSLWAGTNDFKQFETPVADLMALYSANLARHRARGFKTIAWTILPRNPAVTPASFEPNRIAFNAQLRTTFGDFADRLVDVAADPLMGNAGDELATTYYADGVHPNDAGDARIAQRFVTEVLALLAASFVRGTSERVNSFVLSA